MIDIQFDQFDNYNPSWDYCHGKCHTEPCNKHLIGTYLSEQDLNLYHFADN